MIIRFSKKKILEEAGKFLKTPKNEILGFQAFSNGDWRYRDEKEYHHSFSYLTFFGRYIEHTAKGNYHLFRKINGEWVELTENVVAINANSYDNGDWSYNDKNNICHLFRKINNKWIELTENIITPYSSPTLINEYWKCTDEKNYWHLFEVVNGESIKLTQNVKAEWIWSFKNGDWMYRDENKYEHLYRKIDNKWIELTENIKAINVDSYDNGNWRCEDLNGNQYLSDKHNKPIKNMNNY